MLVLAILNFDGGVNSSLKLIEGHNFVFIFKELKSFACESVTFDVGEKRLSRNKSSILIVNSAKQII